MPQHKHRGTYFYCNFCKEEIKPNIVNVKGYKIGGYKNVCPKIALCPHCGGSVVNQAKSRGSEPRVEGTRHIKTKRTHW